MPRPVDPEEFNQLSDADAERLLVLISIAVQSGMYDLDTTLFHFAENIAMSMVYTSVMADNLRKEIETNLS